MKSFRTSHIVPVLLGCACPLPASAHDGSADLHAGDAGIEDVGAPIVVSGSAPGYANATISALKTGTPLIDTPQTVTVLNRAQIDDQGIATLNDALRYVPGVTLGQGEGHRDQIVLR